MKSILVTSVLLFSVFTMAGEFDPDRSRDFLYSVLGIDNPKLDSLAEYKVKGLLYSNIRDKALTKDKDFLKLFILHAHVTPYGIGSESSAFKSDLIRVFRKQPKQFLEALSSLKFPILSSCKWLGGHFGHEDVPLKDREKFVGKFKKRIVRILGKDSSSCLQAIKEST